MFIEQGPIRPPSEASSLLIRVTRNCPWNRCAFCKTYKGEKFSRRSVEDIIKDIDTVNQVANTVLQISQEKGFGGQITSGVVNEAGVRYGHLAYHVAAWLYYGGKSVFLQDANSIMVKTADLVQIIKYIRSIFPYVERITTYARANTVARMKTEEELRELRDAGLNRMHMGMESGSDKVLKLIQKGITSADLLESARKINGAGISLCWYIMPGLGGKEYSRDHALGTAAVINQGNPDYMRFRSTSVLKGTPLYDLMENGQFTPLEEDEMVEEQRLMLESLQGVNTTIVSDHILNLLQELEGTLPDDKDKMLGIIDRYLSMTPDEKANYQLGRRAGIYTAIDDMKNKSRYQYVEKMLSNIDKSRPLSEELARIRRQFV